MNRWKVTEELLKMFVGLVRLGMFTFLGFCVGKAFGGDIAWSCLSGWALLYAIDSLPAVDKMKKAIKGELNE